MSRTTDAAIDHANGKGATFNDVQPDKCHAARLEQAAKFLTEKGYTVIAPNSQITITVK